MKTREGSEKRGTGPQSALIGEMMLAKTVLEEKNELLDTKDRRIHELTGSNRRLQQEIDSLKRELQSRAEHEEASGQQKVLSALVAVLTDYLQGGDAPEARLARRILHLCRRQFGLKTIGADGERLNPDFHCVIEADADQSGGEKTGSAEIEVLSTGYRVGQTVLRPAFVRVGRGGGPDAA